MGKVETIDITTYAGSDTFPTNANDVYGLIETIASQNIRNATSANRIVDGFYNYDVTDGSVLEEAIIAMAEKQEYSKTGAPDLSPKDPKLFVKYFSNWETAQFKTSTRVADIRKIIANKGVGFEEVVSSIIASLTEGEGEYDYKQMREIIDNTAVGTDASTEVFGNKKPKNAKGIIYCAREMYNALKATNKLGGALTEYAVPVDDVRIALSESVLNLLDVTELANVFNLSKEELFGKLVVLPYKVGDEGATMLVYDVRALGRGTRLFEFSQDVIGAGLYTNHYLTTDRIYFYDKIYKALRLDLSPAITTAKGEVLVANA